LKAILLNNRGYAAFSRLDPCGFGGLFSMKRFLVISVLSLATLALAANAVLGSEGLGAARSQDGRIGRFDYRVVKSVKEEHTFFEGRFRFEQVGTETVRPALIQMGQPRAIDVVDNICRFAGPGTMTVPDGHGGRLTVRGAVHCVAADVRTHEHPEGHDRIEVRFESFEHNITYGFAGLVGHGDLVVFTR
jgi:hypothetical protein